VQQNETGEAYSAPWTPSWFLGDCFAAGRGREEVKEIGDYYPDPEGTRWGWGEREGR